MSRRSVFVVLGAIAAIVAVLGYLWMTGLLRPAHRRYPGMPPVINRANLYSEAGPGRLSSNAKDALSRVYVPNIRSGDVYVIDPKRMQVVARFPAGRNPQHVVPSYDLRTLWVAGSAAPGRGPGTLLPIDP